jgi:hypothetical protein
LVLTAAHVVCPTEAPAEKVQVRTETGPVDARVAWRHQNGSVDVALLEVTDHEWSPPVWRHPVRWGRLVTSRAEQPCKAIGFPKMVAEPQRRDSHEAQGVINPGSLVKAKLFAVEVSNPPVGPSQGGSWWAGMSSAALRSSGAGLRSEGLLLGVVTRDPTEFDSRRLVTVPDGVRWSVYKIRDG